MLGAWFDAGEATSCHDRGRTRIRPERDTDGARSCQCGSIDRGSELTEPATDDALGRKRNYPRVCTADFRASQVHPGTRLRRRVRSGSRFSASVARLLLDRICILASTGQTRELRRHTGSLSRAGGASCLSYAANPLAGPGGGTPPSRPGADVDLSTCPAMLADRWLTFSRSRMSGVVCLSIPNSRTSQTSTSAMGTPARYYRCGCGAR